MFFRQIEDPYLSQYAYLIACERTKEALLIDPERDVDRYLELAARHEFEITAVAETHIHADFLSGARELAMLQGITVYLSDAGPDEWKYRWAEDTDIDVQLLKNGDTFTVGNIEIRAVATPGHTPEHLSYFVTDRGGEADEPMGVITGDFVFVGDIGRPDLLESAVGQAGSMRPAAKELFRSAREFLELDDYMQVWPGHGAGSACGKALGSVPETTVGYERRFSPALKAADTGEEAFVDYVLEGQPAPPLYFARMKELNKAGPPLLRSLPQPDPLTPSALAALAGNENAVLLDLRTDREAFARAHVPGAIFAPFNTTFPTVAGSYVEPDQPIYLVVPEKDLDEAVRCLVRIGLDDVRGYAPPEILNAYVEQGGPLVGMERIDFEELEKRRAKAHVVDVRSPAEYEEGHVPGAQLAPHTRLPEEVRKIPRDRELLVHCGSGARASVAASFLQRQGFDTVMVDDLFKNWKANPVAPAETE